MLEYTETRAADLVFKVDRKPEKKASNHTLSLAD